MGITIARVCFWKMIVVVVGLVGAALSAPGCAHFPVNAPLARFDPHAGYRFENLPPTEKNTDAVFVVLAFSGGGMRSAAYSFGLLEELRNTPIRFAGPPRSLLDEVDVVSSVSASSITAAYYAAQQEQMFQTFLPRVLYRDLEALVAAYALNPVNWARLASPTFSRTDLFAELLDNEIYDHLTFADLIRARRRPYVLLNAADFSLGTHFEFTQEQFDFLYSDLASVPLARAVVASMTVPVVLAPVNIENYPHGPDFREPAWLAATLADKNASRRVQQRAQNLRSYEDAANRPHIRVLDGAYGDYRGLQGPMIAFISPDGDFSIRRLINEHKIKKLVIISANVARTPDLHFDRTLRSPSWYDTLYFGLTAPIRNNAAEIVTVFEELLQADHAHKDTPPYESYFITLDFSDVQEPALRQRLEKSPTALSLTRDQVDDLRRAAAEALRNSAEFQRLLKDLN